MTAAPPASDLHPGLTMAGVLAAYPGAQRALFRRYHIGGCSACGFRPEETLAEVCKRNGGIPPGEAVAHLLASREEDTRAMMEPTELRDALRSEPAPRVLDIRTREEWEAARIEGSLLFTQELLQEAISHWPKDAPIVVLDHRGLRSLDAAAYFSGHGFTAVRSLRGGLDAYSTEADPGIPRYTAD